MYQSQVNIIKNFCTILCFTLILLIYAFFLTGYTAEFFVKERLSGTFDSLSLSLMKGESSVEAAEILDEGIKINQKTYAYFGPFPALLRMPVLTMFPELFGKLSRLSCLSASFLILIFFYRAVSGLSKDFPLRIFSLFAFGLGSPLLLLNCSAIIYHEAILWGLCFSIIFVSVFFKFKFTVLDYFILSLSAGLAFLSRLTFGLPLIFVTFCLITREVLISRNFKNICAQSVPVFFTLGFHAWYNLSRFGSVFKFSYIREGKTDINKLGGEFSFSRVLNSLYNYFYLNVDNFSDCTPFIVIKKAEYLAGYARYYLPGYKEWVVPFTLLGFWLILTFLFLGFKFRNVFKNKLFLIMQSGFTIQILLILCHFWITLRFLGDFLPFFVCGYLFLINTGFLNKTLRLCVYTLQCFSIVICILSAVSWTSIEKNFMVSREMRRQSVLYLEGIESFIGLCEGQSNNNESFN